MRMMKLAFSALSVFTLISTTALLACGGGSTAPTAPTDPVISVSPSPTPPPLTVVRVSITARNGNGDVIQSWRRADRGVALEAGYVCDAGVAAISSVGETSCSYGRGCELTRGGCCVASGAACSYDRGCSTRKGGCCVASRVVTSGARTSAGECPRPAWLDWNLSGAFCETLGDVHAVSIGLTCNGVGVLAVNAVGRANGGGPEVARGSAQFRVESSE